MINDGVEDLRVAYTKMIYQNYVGIFKYESEELGQIKKNMFV